MVPGSSCPASSLRRPLVPSSGATLESQLAAERVGGGEGDGGHYQLCGGEGVGGLVVDEEHVPGVGLEMGKHSGEGGGVGFGAAQSAAVEAVGEVTGPV